jgi:nucleoid-associated protein YgaU
MTVDGKIGLLLGLLFIVVIAFLINGPSGFLKGDKPPIETSVPAPPGKSLVIDQAVAEVARQLDPVPLRQTLPPQEVRAADSASSDLQAVVLQSPPAALPVLQPTEVQTSSAPAVQPSSALGPSPAALPVAAVRNHTVQPGENLAVIAVRYYGKEEGNKRATIQKLYEANSAILESPDTIRAGDQLTIPTLEQLTAPPVRPASKPEKKLMDKFKGMFESVPASNKNAPAYKEYVVQQGDHLWEIAEKCLGDGKRYKEIAALNRPQIPDPDHVPAGIRLKIPVQ